MPCSMVMQQHFCLRRITPDLYYAEKPRCLYLLYVSRRLCGSGGIRGRQACRQWLSEHARDGRNANSALLVQIFPEDFGSDHPLAGMLFQRELEEKAFLAGGGSYTAPVQTVGSFLGKGKVEAAEVTATYRPAVRESSLDEIFPAFMTEALREALACHGQKAQGL